MLYFDHFQRNFVKFELTNYVKSTRLTQLYILTSLGKHRPIQVYSPNCSRQKIDAKLSSEPEKLFLHNHFWSEPEKLYARLHAKLHFSFSSLSHSVKQKSHCITSIIFYSQLKAKAPSCSGCILTTTSAKSCPMSCKHTMAIDELNL